MVTMAVQEPAADVMECSSCGDEFRLDRQSYYGPKCPSCRESPATWPCTVCGSLFPRGEGETARVRGPHGRTEAVGVCSERCKDELDAPRRAPR